MTSPPSPPSAPEARDDLADRAFASVALPARPAKPRPSGITVVADKGLGSHQVEDLLEVAGDFVDVVKVASSSVRLYRPEALRRKVATYAAAGVDVLLTGDVVELAVARGLADVVYAEAADLGFAAVEVASAQTVIAVEDEARLVRRAAAHGLRVFAEVGRKGGGGARPHAGWLAEQALQLLDAGADRVLLQGEGITEDVERLEEDLLMTFASRVPLERTVFQAKETRAQVWFLTAFGPHTSMDVDVASAVPLELMRRGIRQRGLVGLVATVD